MNKFKKDPNYLLSYCIKSCLIFGVLNIILVSTRSYSFDLSITSFDFLYLFFAILLCGLPSSLLHNCAHNNLKPFALNKIVGEICGTLMLYGFKGFRLGHLFHHKYPDNPMYDPHPPRGYSFLRFVISPIEATLIIIERAYFEFHGKSVETKKNIEGQKLFFNISIFLRLCFCFLLFGPKLFIIFYLPMYFTNIFVFAHINYATHIENRNGDSEIINLDHNLYYRFVNIVSFGGYYHKNHHLKPKAFNPALVKLKDTSPLITFKGSPTEERKPLFSLRLIHGLK